MNKKIVLADIWYDWSGGEYSRDMVRNVYIGTIDTNCSNPDEEIQTLKKAYTKKYYEESYTAVEVYSTYFLEVTED